MPTNNPKISAYVPQVVYDYFDEFRHEFGLSMSQSAAVIFAKFFGLEDIAKEITGETTTDNSALDRIKVLESQVEDLFKKLSELQSEPKSSLGLSLVSDSQVTDIIASPGSNLQGELLNNPPTEKTNTPDIQISSLFKELPGGSLTQINPIMGKTLIKRLISSETGKNVSPPQLSIENKKATEAFRQWTSELDIDNIQWEYKGRKVGYVPAGELSDELRSRLLKWIEENS